MERVTYLIANYNQGKYIGECIESLHRQSRADWLAVIADDASTDDSLALIRPLLSERIRLLANEENVGYIRTLRTLIESASTDIVALLDADDALEPEATERILETYRQHPEAGLVHSRFGIYSEDLSACLAVAGSRVPPGRTSLEEGFIGAVKSFRRSVYHLTEGLDERMLYAEDRDLVYKLEEVTTSVFIDQVLYRYRDVPGSQSREPRKREIGALSTLRAKQCALERRGVGGPSRFVYHLFFRGEYICYSDRYPRGIKLFAGSMLRVLRLLDAAFSIRRVGQLRRGASLPPGLTVARR